MHTALSWLLPKPSLKQLPVLPQLNDGQYEALVFTHPDTGESHPEEQLILRLWPTTLRLKTDNTPLWTGTVALQHLKHLPLISFPRLSREYGQALAHMETSLPNLEWYSLQCPVQAKENESRWDGTVLLINSKSK